MDLGPPLVAHRKPAVAGEPSKRALYNPPVTAELLAHRAGTPSYTSHLKVQPGSLSLFTDTRARRNLLLPREGCATKD